MKNNSRTINASRNVVFGVVLKIYQTAIPFLLRTALIYFLGIEYIGLNSLFASILQVLNIAELGVGTAMIFSMYKSANDCDEIKMCAILKLYRLYYYVIGAVIAVVGLSLTPFVPFLINNGNYPSEINIYILYLISLFTTVLSYWLLAYKGSLLQAHQRNDIVSKINLATVTVQYLLQLLVLWILQNYYLYVIIALFTQALTNVVVALVVSKLYPNYYPKGDLSKEEKKQIGKRIKDLFFVKIGYVVSNSFDSIVISIFLGLVPLALYNNYWFIMTSITSFISIIFTSITAGIGNSLITDSVEKNFNDLKKLSFIIFTISNFCSCCFLTMYQPFMRIWVGDEFMLSYLFVILMTSLFYVQNVRKIWTVYKDAAGIWSVDRWRPLISAFINLALNLILVQFIGLYGIIISTIVSEVFVSIPWLIHTLFKYVLPVDYKRYIFRIFGYLLVTIACCSICVLICHFINLSDFFMLIVSLAICLLLPNVIQISIFYKTSEFKESLSMMKNIIKSKSFNK